MIVFCYYKVMIEIYAITACIVLAALTLFQILLIAGLPLGRFAWGGTHRVLPSRLRVASISSIFLYGIFAAFVASKARVFTVIDNNSVVTIGMWIFTAYFILGVFMNGISRSAHERALMTPVALVLAVLFFLVASA